MKMTDKNRAGSEHDVSTARPVAWGSDYIAKLLRHIDLEYVALNPGASFRGLHDSLVNHLGDKSPQMLTVLHEEHAVAIAHGYAKVAGKPMGAILHSNVGLLHGSMAIFDAFCDRVPVLVFGATGPVDTARRRPWIDWLHTSKDQGALVRSFLKWDAEPASLEAARDALLRARQIATTLPAGPTYVCFDSGLQETPASNFPVIPPLERYAPPELPSAPAETVGRLAKAAGAADNVVLLAGRVSRNRDDWDRRVALAEHLNAKVLTDFKVGAAFPTWHPNHVGAPAYFLEEEGLEALRSADLVISLDWVDLGGTLKMAWGDEPRGHVVQVSLDQTLHNGFGGEHQALFGADTYIMSDPDRFVLQLLAELRGASTPRLGPQTRPHFRSSKPTSSSCEASEIPMESFAATVAEMLNHHAPASLIRTNLGWPGGAWAFDDPLDYLGYDGGGGVGSGPGMAVGAALALRGGTRLPVAVLGDGDFLMGVTALWTAVRYKIPLLVVVANNRSFFNDEVHQEKVAIVRGRPVENKSIGQRIEEPDVDIAGMARAQGAKGFGPVHSAGLLAEALESAVAAVRSGAVAVIDARVSREYAKAMTRGLTRGD
jgi:acetolactate synthase I/II/III large subunit